MRKEDECLPIPDTVYLHECFEYQPMTGRLVWKHRPRHHFANEQSFSRFNNKYAGREAGCAHYQKGRASTIHVRIGNHCYRAHRIIFGMMGHPIPEGMLGDHVNRNPLDNKWENLRLATRTQNNRNMSMKCTNTTGFTGVCRAKGIEKYRATITVDRRSIHLGTFSTPEEAAIARSAAVQKYYSDFAAI
jgi:hypothetical protein